MKKTNETTDAATTAKNIRRALKAELGANARQISVRSSSFSGGGSVSVRVVSGDFDRAAVAAIARRFENIVRDDAGNMLSGRGSIYVNA